MTGVTRGVTLPCREEARDGPTNMEAVRSRVRLSQAQWKLTCVGTSTCTIAAALQNQNGDPRTQAPDWASTAGGMQRYPRAERHEMQPLSSTRPRQARAAANIDTESL